MRSYIILGRLSIPVLQLMLIWGM